MRPATLYLDLGSPYAYLAAERVGRLFGDDVELQPVLLGAMFKLRGWGSWAATEGREAGMKEIESRAGRYGLPPIVWPAEWPANALAADRAAIYAGNQGRGESFIRALYRLEFAQGADISDSAALEAAAGEAGLAPGEILEAIQRPDIKERLRQATDAAWEAGVRGVPSIRIGSTIFYGDDKLEEAAEFAVANAFSDRR